VKTKSNKQANFDIPIEKPFDELPEWFVRNLRSRLVTKKMTKGNDTTGRKRRDRRYDTVSSV
jgi:hypothetical protein